MKLPLSQKIHPDLSIAQRLAYEPNGLIIEHFMQEAESQEYGASTFTVSQKSIVFRVAKTTPTKIGQFVTLWKRIAKGPILPFDTADLIDFFIVSVRKKEKLGQFIFPASVLEQKGFISHKGKGGKRAMRVYPPWDSPTSSQADQTQSWQLLYFVALEPTFDANSIKRLFR
jgi:hypothetical protein